MFETMGLGGGDAAGGDGGLGALFPLMQVMLENVLSKEVLYSPMKDITDKVREDEYRAFHVFCCYSSYVSQDINYT